MDRCYRIRFLDEVRTGQASGAAPIAALAVVVLAGKLHAGTATIE